MSDLEPEIYRLMMPAAIKVLVGGGRLIMRQPYPSDYITLSLSSGAFSTGFERLPRQISSTDQHGAISFSLPRQHPQPVLRPSLKLKAAIELR